MAPSFSTRFPSINGNSRELLADIFKDRNQRGSMISNLTEIPLTGTVKLHGTHADIVIDCDDIIKLQSRNKTDVTLEKDQYTYASTMIPLRGEILELKAKYICRFRELNPKAKIQKQQPLIIAGEWIGPGIFKDVAINELPKKCFVIVSVSINGEWVVDESYADIHNESVGIYNISRGGYYHETLSLKDPEQCFATMQTLTNAVEEECPFAKSFGISGVGEGIVWKPAPPLGHNPKFWIKSKGPKHTEGSGLLKPINMGLEKMEWAQKFAGAVVGNMRLHQGWDYLAEMGVSRNSSQSMKKFLDWLWNDVEAEEKGEMERWQLEQSVVKSEVRRIGSEWFLKKQKRG